MTDAALDHQPVVGATDAPSPTPAPAPGQSPEQITGATDQAHDDEGLDLLSVNGEDADAEVEAGDAAETSIKPIGPGEDATDEEKAAWRKEHGVPDDAAGYAPTVEGVEWDQEALTPILQIAHEHNLPSKPVADALAAYAKRVQEQQTQIKARDAANAKAVRAEFTDAEITAVKTAARAMRADLRTLLNQARAPDGSRIINNPDVLRMITSTYGAKPGARSPMEMTDTRTSLQAELGEIDASMYADATNLRRPWKGTGMTAGERKEQIISEIGNRPPAAKVREEEAALLALHARDPDVFQYTPDWRGTKKTGAQRLFEIRSGRT